MAKFNSDYSTDPEARKVVARNVDLPQCEGLRVCAALTSIAQFVLTSNQYLSFDLTIVVQIGFGLIGFMVAAYLLRDRDLTTECEIYDEEGFGSSLRGLIRTLPLPQMATVVVLVLLLPKMTALEGFKMPDMAEVPAIIVKMFATYFADFQRSGFNGRNLLIFPLVVLFVPRRCLSMVLLTVLGAGLILQFVGLFSGSIRPAAMFESPSAFDLLAAGCILAVISRQHRIGRSEAQIGISAVLSGFVLAGGLIGSRLVNASTTVGTVALFSAPSGFGLSNFVVEIVGTTLVASLFWKDLGGMMEDVTRAPAH
jgi:hypothetical protein